MTQTERIAATRHHTAITPVVTALEEAEARSRIIGALAVPTVIELDVEEIILTEVHEFGTRTPTTSHTSRPLCFFKNREYFDE